MIEFNDEEKQANDHLMEFMNIVQREWGLNCNEGEFVHAIHTLQFFIMKHMLQRLEAKDFSEWYDGV